MSDSTLPHRGRPIDLHARNERAAQILRGARTCFVRSGFHKASIAEIAREASVSVANIYQYFDNKESMILALIERHLIVDRQNIIALADTGFATGPFEAVVRELFCTQEGLDWARLRQEIVSEAARNPEIGKVVVAADEESIALIAQRLRDGMARGQFRAEIDPPSVARTLAYLAEGFLTRIVFDPAAGPDLANLFTRTVLNALQPNSR